MRNSLGLSESGKRIYALVIDPSKVQTHDEVEVIAHRGAVYAVVHTREEAAKRQEKFKPLCANNTVRLGYSPNRGVWNLLKDSE